MRQEEDRKYASMFISQIDIKCHLTCQADSTYKHNLTFEVNQLFKMEYT